MAKKARENKQEAIALFEQGVSSAKAAKQLGIPAGTCRTWKTAWNKAKTEDKTDK